MSEAIARMKVATREQLLAQLGLMRQDLKRALSLPVMARHHPFLVTGAAFAAGYLLTRRASPASPATPGQSGTGSRLLGVVARRLGAFAYQRLLHLLV
jgi:hypothetical protein